MASLVYFRKVAETDDSIEYIFGFDTDEPPGRLLMDTKSRRSRPIDGEINYAFLKASREINALYEEASEWPERGMSVS
ncbi:hypothetical protein [Streptomyces sp. 35G-GA-8]|uniref:hypothetical protein n=1 Tax=Streptomyces sp. 35G-GA-8 TaxID=2939434 RepID=UPI00201FB177|nr:hypothetical protein [Streptomyces sp. 35G-GA-8]MCL7377103.1 hypothetical protein [Streptomyces sp. 35G-GA-8]